MNTKKGECIQDRICSFGSKSAKDGAHCKVSTSNEPPFKNYLLDSTITSSRGENNLVKCNIYLFNGEMYMRSINISNINLNHRNFYEVYCSSNSNVTFSTFSNTTASNSSGSQAYHLGSSTSLEFKIKFCNYFENDCYYFMRSDYTLYIDNCSFYDNNIRTRSFVAMNNSRIQISQSYFYKMNLKVVGTVIITDNASTNYPENHHLSSFLCYANHKLEFPTKNNTEEEILVNIKPNYNFMFIIFLISQNS